ncbi:uncharacterized protein LOC116198654 [Punica granatum]|uniref:Uncharacterized protein LOC116198654 n=2 Tax=Punica granatum TaxID=22663 RepID=A0A6P8CKI9_PUNGR|nr:uncharacterized protein LOC116198654 [Punica granatum]PKI71562.1 hypothetical protein CRG98_008079 [Punica granatum]
MGMKFLNRLQILPWCFHLIRTHHAAAAEAEALPPSDPIKLIKSDGQVSVYHRPVHVSELMSEFPKHLICHSDSFYIGQKIPALSENDQLQLGQKYFVLPSHFFQSVLSFVTIASFVSSQPSAAPLSGAAKKAAAQHQLFDVQRTPSGGLRIRVSDEFISQLMKEGRNAAAAAERRREAEDEYEGAVATRDGACGGRRRVCTTAQLERDYEQLVAGSRSRRWKPELEAIKERSEKRRGLISKSFGIRRRKNSQPNHHLRSETSSKKSLPPSKSRLRMRSRK